MGANNFEHYERHPDAKEAFRIAHDQARYEHGSGGYSGTLAEKHGFVIIQQAALPYHQASQLANELIEQDDPRISDKWGPAGAIPVTEAEAGSATQVITIQNPTPKLPRYRLNFSKLAEDALNLEPNQVILGTRIIKATEKVLDNIQTTPGAAITKYYLSNNMRDGYPTLPEAQAALEQFVQNNSNAKHYEVNIIGMIKREDGSPLVTAERTTQETSFEVEVTIGEIAANAPTKGWLFFGWASS